MTLVIGVGAFVVLYIVLLAVFCVIIHKER